MPATRNVNKNNTAGILQELEMITNGVFMKTRKIVKPATCQVLIRNYPEEIADQVKSMTGEKTLSRALIAVSRAYLELKQDHEKLVDVHTSLQDRCQDMDSRIKNYLGALKDLELGTVGV